jgi:hypothetical protein
MDIDGCEMDAYGCVWMRMDVGESEGEICGY